MNIDYSFIAMLAGVMFFVHFMILVHFSSFLENIVLLEKNILSENTIMHVILENAIMLLEKKFAILTCYDAYYWRTSYCWIIPQRIASFALVVFCDSKNALFHALFAFVHCR